MNYAINMLDPRHVQKVMEVYRNDLYWLRLAKMAIHAMFEHGTIDPGEARRMRCEVGRRINFQLDKMRVKPGRGTASIGAR